MKSNLLKISETQIQIAILDWARWHENQHPALRNLIHIPNQGKRSWRQGKEFKAMGLKKGFPDLFLFHPLDGKLDPAWSYPVAYGLAIEVKSEKGKLSLEQLYWKKLLTDAGYWWREIRSVDEGIAFLKEYLRIK